MERPPPSQREPYAAVFAQRFEKVGLPLSAKSSKLPPIRRSSPSPAACPTPSVPGQGHRASVPGRAARAGRRAAIRHHRGLCPLRQFIADRYLSRHGMAVNPDNILITSGSQQALDLLGKVLVNEGGSHHRRAGLPWRHPGVLRLSTEFQAHYPGGRGWIWPRWMRCWSRVQRQAALRRAQLPEPERCFPQPRQPGSPGGAPGAPRSADGGRRPYGELRFEGNTSLPSPSWPHNTVLLGSFSKTVVPAFRLGWMVVPDWLRKKVTIAKQATDLHSNAFSQQVLHRFLTDNSLDAHLGRSRRSMVASVPPWKPPSPATVRPASATPVPKGHVPLADPAAQRQCHGPVRRGHQEKVAFVPGAPFYVRPDQEYPAPELLLCGWGDHGRGCSASVPRPGPHALSHPAAKKTSDPVAGFCLALSPQRPCPASWLTNSFMGMGLPNR